MKTSYLIVLFILLTSSLFAQYKDLNKLPQKERDSILVKIANETIKKYSTGYLRPGNKPHIQDIGIITGKQREDYIALGDGEYVDRYHYAVAYPPTEEERAYFKRTYLVKVVILADVGKAHSIRFIDDNGYYAYGLERLPPGAKSPIAKREYTTLEAYKEKIKKLVIRRPPDPEFLRKRDSLWKDNALKLKRKRDYSRALYARYLRKQDSIWKQDSIRMILRRDSIRKSEDNFMKEARKYFEQNTTNIQNVRIGKQKKELSKSLNLSSSIITPRWEEQEFFKRRNILTLEIPLEGNVVRRSIYSRKRKDSTLSSAYSNVTMKLVIQKHETAKLWRYFIVTILDHDYFYNPSKQRQPNKIGYMTPPSNGLIIFSDVEGNYMGAFMYEAGRQKKVQLARASGIEGEINPDYIDGYLSFMETGTTNLFSRSGESGGGGGTIVYCALCGKANCNGSCEFVVTYCPICHRPTDQCSGHTPDPDPDPQWYCPVCGSPLCHGDCQTGGGGTPSPDPDECHHQACPVCGKMIRTSTRALARASVCDSHEYCENNGMCIAVQISVSRNQVSLGESYTLTLDLTPANARYIDITYILIKNGEAFPLPKEQNSTTLTTMARSPGRYQLRAEVMQAETGKTYSSNTIGITHLFPHRNEILDQKVVMDGINDAWTRTLAATDASGMQEFGGTVIINTRSDNTGDLYRFKSCHGQKKPYDSLSVEIQLDDHDIDFGPDRGGEFTVLFFHAHPPFWGYTGTSLHERRVGPSDIDIENHTGIPAVVKDFQHQTDSISTKMSRSEYENTEKLYHYGEPERKKLK